MSDFPDWTNISNKPPTVADLPILLWNSAVPKVKYTATEDALRSQLVLTCFTHWMPAPPDPVKLATLKFRMAELRNQVIDVFALATALKHECAEELRDAEVAIATALKRGPKI
jgi:hypothetical protein